MNLLLLSILFFLGVSLLLYVLLGGADFGAGILELFLGSKQKDEQRRLISHAMAPVWEANHVWLILVVVILFMGFPSIYTLTTTYLHLPLLAVLMGIVARGCAFTFRHYDTLGQKYYATYTRVFAFSSVWTALFLGITAGALTLGKISTDIGSFAQAYIHPWLNLFCLSMGVFTCTLFAFLASVFLVGEANNEEIRKIFITKVRWSNWAVVVSGALVFLIAEIEGPPLLNTFFTHPVSVACFALATVVWIPFIRSLNKKSGVLTARVLAVCVVSLVMVGWFEVQFPTALLVQKSGLPYEITFESAAAPVATLKALLGALVVGSLLIFPALIYLIKVFKWETFETKR